MKDAEFKVSDKRMFTPDGRLREEYQHLEDSALEPPPANTSRAEAPTPESGAPAAGTAGTGTPETRAADASRGDASSSRPAVPEPPPPASGAEKPSGSQGQRPQADAPASGEPTILDLVGLLAEHTALYLGEVSLPDGQTMRDLQAAKLHLDLLDVLRAKTQGNLTREESTLLEDVLYRLRMLYVEKKRQGA